MMLSSRRKVREDNSQIALLYDSNEFQTKIKEKIEEERLETEMEKYLKQNSSKESESNLADDDEIQINDVVIEMEEQSLTLAKVDEPKSVGRETSLKIEEDSLVNGTKKVDSMRLKLNEPTPDSRLNREMLVDSETTPHLKTPSVEKPNPTAMLIPKKKTDPKGQKDGEKKAACACCTLF